VFVLHRLLVTTYRYLAALSLSGERLLDLREREREIEMREREMDKIWVVRHKFVELHLSNGSHFSPMVRGIVHSPHPKLSLFIIL
jgi:hypothetical protein